jgi:hypothetical protein
MFKRFLLLTSGLLVVLSGPPSRVLAERDHWAGATVTTPAVAERVIEDRTRSGAAFDGNQEQ